MDEPQIEGDPAHATSAPATRPADAGSDPFADSDTVSSLLPRVILTPRDVIVVGLDDSRLDLNGTWQFVHAVPDAFDGRAESVDHWKTLTVPKHFALQGFPRMHAPDGVPVAYAKQFDVPASWKDRQIVLRFEGVDGLTKLFVNGQPAGESDIACLPSEFDVTRFVRIGEMNQITLTVEKSLVTRWSRRELGGITRPVYLQALPKVRLARLHVDTILSPDHATATMRTHLRVTNDSDGSRNAKINLKLRRPDGATTQLNVKPVPLGWIAAGRTIEVSLPFEITKPMLWSAESPILYTVEAELLVDEKPTMSARQRFGFRSVAVEGYRLLVNGVPVKLRGANYHITYPEYGESVPRELIHKDLKLMLDANFNTLRPRPTPSQDYIDLCDELGIYTTVEAMISLMIYDAGPQKDHGSNPAIAAGYRRHVATMIESGYSNPSILTWGLGNECPYYDYFQTAALGMKALDTTRPLFFGSDNRLGVGIPFMDINDDHYPRDGRTTTSDPGAIVGKGWDYPEDRPNIFTEWMHVPTNNTKEIAFDPAVDDFWGYVAEAHIEYMDRTPDYAGGFQFKAAPYRGIGVNAPWRGIFDDQRRPNDMFWHNKKAHSPIHLKDRAGRFDPATRTARFDVTNRYDFTDLSAITFRWHRGDEQGEVRCTVAPHAKGEIELPFDIDQPTTLHALSVEGRLIDAWTLGVEGTVPTTQPAGQRSADNSWTITEASDEVRVAIADQLFVVDRKTGLLSSASVSGRPVIDGTPTLLVLPAQLRNFRGQQTLTLVNQASEWKPTGIEVTHGDQVVTIKTIGTYKQLEGTFVTRIERGGMVRIGYDFVWSVDVERPITCFSWGLALPVTAACDTLFWDRAAQWTAYPDDHIGRPIGEARAVPASTATTKPYAWSQELVDGVTRDFRSTKFYIRHGGLRAADGRGVRVEGDATQHLQAVPINGDLGGEIRVRETHGEPRPGWYLHVMPFHNGGTEPHLTKSLRFETLDIDRGTRFKGEAVLQLLP